MSPAAQLYLPLPEFRRPAARVAGRDLLRHRVAETAAAALRQELDFMAGTRSWKVTAPLRKWKGRGAS